MSVSGYPYGNLEQSMVALSDANGLEHARVAIVRARLATSNENEKTLYRLVEAKLERERNARMDHAMALWYKYRKEVSGDGSPAQEG